MVDTWVTCNSSAYMQGHGEHLFLCLCPYFMENSPDEVSRMGLCISQINFSIVFLEWPLTHLKLPISAHPHQHLLLPNFLTFASLLGGKWCRVLMYIHLVTSNLRNPFHFPVSLSGPPFCELLIYFCSFSHGGFLPFFFFVYYQKFLIYSWEVAKTLKMALGFV